MLNIKKIQDIMREDSGVNGDAQRIEQIVWILFLKIYDEYEKRWRTESSLDSKSYHSILPSHLAWDKWANDEKLSGEDLLKFVNETLLPTLKKDIATSDNTPLRQSIVKKVFEETNNYMKNGILLRKVINEINSVKLDSHHLSATYEHFLKTLQSAGNAGEFYTPRALTDFVMEILKPKIGEKIADLACGTGGFLISAYHVLEPQQKKASDIDALNSAFFGIEKKSLPFILCATSFFINGLERPNLEHSNAFEKSFEDLDDMPKFDIIAMNPPYGGIESKEIQDNFPKIYKSSETADLFVAIIIERLKQKGRAAVVLPDGFLFGDDTPKLNLKKRLLNECDLHLILRLPSGVFAPYTSIATNVLFFNKSAQGTNFTQFYRLDMPENIKSFSKTKPMQSEHFDDFRAWDKSGRATLSDEKGNFKAKKFSKEELESRNYNFDLCGFVSAQEEILSPNALIEQIKSERTRLNHTLDSLMRQIQGIIKDNE